MLFMNTSFQKSLKPIISIRNATIRLGEKTVFSNTTFEILPGQQWIFLGGNGSGKSLFINALSGRHAVDGEIRYCFDGNEDPDIDTHIGIVSFENQRDLHTDDNRFVQARFWSSDESITVREYLSQDRVRDINPFEVGAYREPEKSYNNFLNRICNLLDIKGLFSRNIDQLSNGESRRILIARALLRRPSLLFLDSPFQGLDSSHRALFCKAFSGLVNQGLQIVIITADQNDSFQGLTHCAVFDNYKIIKAGPVGTLHNFKRLWKSALKIGVFPQITISYQKRCAVPVRMRNVTVRYGRNVLLKNVNWEVNAGSHWVICGHNGAGKSTLLSLITGDNPQAYANDIDVFGKPFGKGRPLSEVRRLIGMVSPELHACFPINCTCIDTVCSGFSDTIGFVRQCGKKRREIAFKWLETFGLESFSNLELAALSEGGQRCVLLARALVKNPQLLILDEPCQGLDRKYRMIILQIIDMVAQRGNSTVLYVTHNLDEVPKCITDRLILEKGNVVL